MTPSAGMFTVDLGGRKKAMTDRLAAGVMLTHTGDEVRPGSDRRIQLASAEATRSVTQVRVCDIGEGLLRRGTRS